MKIAIIIILITLSIFIVIDLVALSFVVVRTNEIQKDFTDLDIKVNQLINDTYPGYYDTKS